MKVQFLIVFFLAAVRCQATESVLDLFPEFKQAIGSLQTRIAGLVRENKVLKAEVDRLGIAGSENTYTRWGKTSCPSTAALVYEGYAAGNAKNEKGGGANFLCLPKDPEWRSYSDSKATWIGRIFGVEYQIKDNSVYSTSFHDKEMSCSVCLITERSTSLMVPGKVTCPTGWTKEYTGYLMSQAIADNRQPSEYICVDENLDAVDGNKADNDQGNVYLVEGVCGSLRCPPYVGGRELTCVVCSK